MYDGLILGFDTETTGVQVFEDDVRIVTCAFVWSPGGGQPDTSIEWMMDPGIDIPTEASDVHGITTEVARAEGMEYTVGIQKIADVLTKAIKDKVPLTAYNGSFDATLIRVEFWRTGVNFDDSLWNDMILIDPMVMAKHLVPFRKGGQKLEVVAKHYGYDLSNAHNATADVEATIYVARKIIPEFVKKIENSFGTEVSDLFPDLMQIQPVLFKQQKESLEQYFRSPKGGKGSDFTLNKTWPFQTPGVD